MKKYIIVGLMLFTSLSLNAASSFDTYKNEIENQIKVAHSYFDQIEKLKSTTPGLAISGVAERAKNQKIHSLEVAIQKAINNATDALQMINNLTLTPAQKSLTEKLTKEVELLREKALPFGIDF